MTSSLQLLALLSTLALTAAAAADLTGLPLPAGINSLDALAVFIVTLVATIVSHDYARPRLLPLTITGRPLTFPIAARADHALAA